MFGATALPGGRQLFSTNQGTPATWRETTVVGWAGMRGAISLAAALALPTSFAERDLVLFLTFAVIVATLVGQGLTLPPLIRRLGLVSRGEQDAVLAAEARRRLAVIALARIDDLAATRGTPDAVTERVRTGYEALIAQVDRRLDLLSDDGTGPGAPAEGGTPAVEAELGAPPTRDRARARRTRPHGGQAQGVPAGGRRRAGRPRHRRDDHAPLTSGPAGDAEGRLRRGALRVLRCCVKHREAREAPDGTTVRLGRPVGVWLGFARWYSEPPQRPATSRVPTRWLLSWTTSSLWSVHRIVGARDRGSSDRPRERGVNSSWW